MEGPWRKAYVSVNLDVDEDGVPHPRLIRWPNGREFPIDQLKEKCRAASTRVSGGGIRYTVLIRGRKHFSFRRETSGLWRPSRPRQVRAAALLVPPDTGGPLPKWSAHCHRSAAPALPPAWPSAGCESPTAAASSRYLRPEL